MKRKGKMEGMYECACTSSPSMRLKKRVGKNKVYDEYLEIEMKRMGEIPFIRK